MALEAVARMARTRIFQPTLSLLIGLAMAVYGLIHAATHLPAGDDLRTLWASMPAAGAYGLFLLGVIAVVCGIALLVAGGQTLRRRVRQVDRVLNVPGSGRDFNPKTAATSTTPPTTARERTGKPSPQPEP